MNPHEAALLSPNNISSLFRHAIAQGNTAAALDIYSEIESRFQRNATDKEGSQKFIDEFLALSGSSEIRALHIDNRLQQCVGRFEYLMELAGERARKQTSEETLYQIVESRERGREMVNVLSEARSEGMIASELAERLGISAANLSPLIRLFNVHRVISRTQQGKNVFLRLTPQGHAILKRIGTSAKRPLILELSSPKGPRESDLQEDWGSYQQQVVLGEVMLKLADDVRKSPWRNVAVPHIVPHSLDAIAAKYETKVAEFLRAIGDEIRKKISKYVA